MRKDERREESRAVAAAVLLREVVGLTVAQAAERAGRAGFYVEDRTGPGWFTQDQDLRRIAVVVDGQGTITGATVG